MDAVMHIAHPRAAYARKGGVRSGVGFARFAR